MEVLPRVVSVGGEEFVIREPRTPEEHRELMELERLIWASDYREVFPYHITIPLLEIGGVVVGVYRKSDGRPVGVLIMMPGLRRGKLIYYSHMLGFLREFRGRGLGLKLKEVQREIALSRGIDLITWTFEPLMVLNAWFNFVKVGVIAREYKVNYYGIMEIEYTKGVESDRLLVEWYLRSERVKERMAGRGEWRDLNYFLRSGGKVVLEAVEGGEGFSLPRRRELGDSNVVLVEIPKDFVEMQVKTPHLVREWRDAYREVFERYLSEGYVVFDVTRGGGRYFYVMWRRDLESILEGEYP